MFTTLSGFLGSLTRQAGGDVDVGTEAPVGQELGHPVPGLHAEGVVGVGQQVERGDGQSGQSARRGYKSHGGAARLTVPAGTGDTPAARHHVTQVTSATRVRWGRPFQHQSGVSEGVDQIPRGRRGAWNIKV